MPRFRPLHSQPSDADHASPSPAALRDLIVEVFRPTHFFVAPSLRVAWEYRGVEECVWEVFQGRLLDPAHTRQRRTFECYNLFQLTDAGRAAEPLLSLKLDRDAHELHIVRGLNSFVWEGYDAGGNVYLSREVQKWVRELVGTVKLKHFATLGELRDELICQLFHGVVGTSRLPLASVETPLPQFSFGELFYCYRHDADAKDGFISTYHDLVNRMLTSATAWQERSRLLETFLHVVPFAEMPSATALFVEGWLHMGQSIAELMALLRTLFNEVALSPYTDLVDKTLAFLEAPGFTAAMVVDFLGYLLRQNGRHLTAYDLITFHHRGANYPDALLLDTVLKEYLSRAERHGELFTDRADDTEDTLGFKRRRRRALRQGYLLRHRYEGHPVPDLPTSPGENNRVLPASHPRVPEEQLTHPNRRTKRLYANDPLANYVTPMADLVLRQSVADLEHPDELLELGMALFLDRPFGFGKAVAEPDATLLLSAEAFSRSIAEERLDWLTQNLGLLTPKECARHRRRLRESLEIKGLPVEAIGSPPRPSGISLSDARRAAPDFVFLRNTAATRRELFEQYDFGGLAERFHLDFLSPARNLLLARAANGAGLILYDEAMRPRLRLEVNAQLGYWRRAGREFPVGGLVGTQIDGVRLEAVVGAAIHIQSTLADS